MSETQFAQALEAALVAHVDGAVAVHSLTRLSGGASQETWAFTLETRSGDRPLILRRPPGGGVAPQLAVEAAAIGAARANGVPAPEIVYLLKPEDGAGDGYVMARVEGETLARRILRDPVFDGVRPGLAAQCGQVLARLHATNVESLTTLDVLDGPAQLRQFRQRYEAYDQPKPVFELAFVWLADRLTAPRRLSLVHGDFRHGNLMIHPETGLASVLDWELTHVGDPLEDIGWMCVNAWRFGQIDKPVGGFGRLEDLLDAYAAAGGEPWTPEQVKVWEVLGTLKWGIMCMSMYEIFRTGADRSVERAAIGRRSSETEIDLLNLILD